LGKELGDSHEGGEAPLDVHLLSANEVRLAAAVVSGNTNAEIANAFALSAPSVEMAVVEVCRKARRRITHGARGPTCCPCGSGSVDNGGRARCPACVEIYERKREDTR